MGSTAQPLEAFADYCSRVGLERRPTVYVQYYDIWGEPLGEIGVPDPTDISRACFALLTPWSMIPTIGAAWLIVDAVDALEMTCLRVNARGMFNPHWSVKYSISDDGWMSFDDAEPAGTPGEMGLAVIAAKHARTKQVLWRESHTLETATPIVIGLLNKS